MKAKWLYSKHPIVIDTDLAVALGSNGDREAIVLQQLNYWLHSKWAKEINGRMWIYNTFENWQKDNFPWLSLPTVKRIFTKLEKKGLIITGNFNKAGFDKTKWYSIDEDRLNELVSHASYQNDTTRVSKRDDGEYQNDTTYTRDYTDTTTDKDIYSSAKAEPAIYKEVIDYLNEKAGTKYKSTSKATQRLINARANDGFKVADFKHVIDTKCAQWRGDKKMAKYLRPETLFGTKFESYLNEKAPNVPQHADFDADAFTNGQIEGVNEDELPF
ncbi:MULTISPECIES: conserved phage C-terminal domain-containing protein [unclassified Lactobacillus]|uniref:conserved phage C-terminal domain-containing protein n=1 Tax=unclassified Lactobacillus TaxID=2620435 RepID=UPI0011C45A43|nr:MULTISPECIES: conserved phage C-terminal domain-containing protein [unclassified Lactobacillus]